MTDRGLQEAIRAAGGVTELARRIGISQPSVSNWSRVPAERVLTVEALTGVARAILRPDLYDENNQATGVDETDLARAQDPTPLGMAHVALADAAGSIDASRVEREFFNLFIGVGRGELMPYGSYYIAGFLHERPLARLREDLAALGIERAEGQYESEDHAAILCEIMSGIAGGQFPTPAGADLQLFEKHLAPWLGRFFADLERAENANFYRRVGTLGRVFTVIESEAFALAS